MDDQDNVLREGMEPGIWSRMYAFYNNEPPCSVASKERLCYCRSIIVTTIALATVIYQKLECSDAVTAR